jgi:hypothetical protein
MTEISLLSLIMQTTVITHIYNEEYLLPFWLTHHKKIFDNGIIIDYRSTDRSLEICRTICPDWKIVTTRNSCFGAMEVDREVMDIEESIDGIKMVLNTTEFLLCNRPLKEIFQRHAVSCLATAFQSFTQPVAFRAPVIAPYTTDDTYPSTLKELFTGSLTASYHTQQWMDGRYVHSYKNGNYNLGRHTIRYMFYDRSELFVLWCGFYPMNEHQMARKLQIKNNIPESDKQNGFGFQHLYDYDKIKSVQREKYASGKPLQELDHHAYNILVRLAQNTTDQ